MKVLVTGGAGFIGSHLCEALIDRGNSIVIVDDFDDFYDPAIKRRNMASIQERGRCDLVEGDIRDAKLVETCTRDVDVIVHLAARAGVRPSIQQPALYQDVNVGGTTNLLEAARINKVKRFVFASSSSVYGNNKKIPFSESDNVDYPISPYAATKKACELLCHTYYHLFEINITCLRFFTAYGPRQRPDLAIHKFAQLIEAGKPIPVFGDGGTMRDYTYVGDVVDGVLAATDRCEGYHIYNICGANPVKLNDLITAIEKALGKKAVIDRLPLQPGDVDRTYGDITLVRDELGYNPQISLDEGLAKFVQWFRNQPL